MRLTPSCLPVPALRITIYEVGSPAASAAMSAPMICKASIPSDPEVRNTPMPSAPLRWASWITESIPAFCNAIAMAGPAM